MSYNAGTGLVPAIGTTITQGAVSGYFLGVWANITAAPSAVGAAMSVTGFIKFREVINGSYVAGALTGIGASAVSPDVVGWIEVVHDQAAAITVPRLGDFTVRGGWFDLGVTTGVANQLLSIPTNGSATTYTPGVWIANVAVPIVDSDWDFYPSVYAAGLIAANFGTDARSRVVCMETNGQIRIGHNGTVAIGILPPAGRKIRIPNVFGRQATTAARAVNVIPNASPTTRPDFTTTGAGAIDIENFTSDWYLSFDQPYSIKIKRTAVFEWLYCSEVASPLDISDGGNGLSQASSTLSFSATSCFAGGSIDKWYALRHGAASSGHVFQLSACIGQNLTNIVSGVATFARLSGAAYTILNSSNITMSNCRQINGTTLFTTSSNCTVANQDHVDRYVGATNTTTGQYAINTSGKSNNIIINGLTFGLNGTVANCHPYSGLLFCSLSSNIKLRNVGTRSAIINGGTNPPLFIFASGGNNQNIKLQRVYLQPTGTGAISTVNSDKGNLYEHVYGDFADVITRADLNSTLRNCAGTNTVAGQASVYGSFFSDAFTSDTSGRVWLMMNEKTTETNTFQINVAGSPKFTSAGNLVLAVVGDEVIMEMNYRVLGVTSFANVIPTVTGTNATFSANARWGNHDIFYQIDKGLGYGGTWINFNQANLFAVTDLSPSAGFKIKFRLVCAVAATTNLLTYIRFDTVSTLAAQTNNLYPLDVATVELTGLIVGSEIRAYLGTNPSTAVEIGGIETSGTTFSFTQNNTGSSGYIVVFNLGYQAIKIPITYPSTDISIPIQQVIDRVYLNV
jgi:hypothetical protein